MPGCACERAAEAAFTAVFVYLDCSLPSASDAPAEQHDPAVGSPGPNVVSVIQRPGDTRMRTVAVRGEVD
jgi:hypothetical protein